MSIHLNVSTAKKSPQTRATTISSVIPAAAPDQSAPISSIAMPSAPAIQSARTVGAALRATARTK